MSKLTTPSMIASRALIAAPPAMAQGRAVAAKTYSSCTALQKDFPKGVAYSSYTVGTSGAKVSMAVYNANWKKLDKYSDDGSICEKRSK